MSDKRRDDKGRILKTGESQRKDSMYQYRYMGVDYAAGGITVITSTFAEVQWLSL